MNVCRVLALAFSLLFSITLARSAGAAETIKVGILHSLSGTMAISETSLLHGTREVGLSAAGDVDIKIKEQNGTVVYSVPPTH